MIRYIYFSLLCKHLHKDAEIEQLHNQLTTEKAKAVMGALQTTTKPHSPPKPVPVAVTPPKVPDANAGALATANRLVGMRILFYIDILGATT